MEIVFSTFNARYSHTALALRCLRANLGDLHDRSVIVEFDNRLSPQAAAENLLACDPQMILFSVYIWNLTVITETAAILRTLRPALKIIIGGPEVSYEYEDLALFRIADHLICGEGESVIKKVCLNLLTQLPRSRTSAANNCRAGTETPPSEREGLEILPKVIDAPPADLKTIALPYDEYTDEDIAHRRIYVETSRGCPFRCEYCLSALEESVRFFPPDRILPEFEKLLKRGVRIFKFLDRSFNINASHAAAVLRFFLENRRTGMMLHLEWEPEHLPPTLEKLIAEAPSGFLQLEVGIQTFNPEVAARIDRPLNAENVEKHIRILAAMPSAHLHADLIAGLPGETFESIAAGFDRLHACGPQEIQLGILKKLRGAPIAHHDVDWQMVYNTSPPYDVLQTSTLSFAELQQIRRFARFWDVTVNNGRFPNTASFLWQEQPSVFSAFMEWSEWLYQQTGSSAGIAPPRLARLLETFLIAERGLSAKTVNRALKSDAARGTAQTVKGRERQARHEDS
jgi:radical SAM superfamily enzyme YgiQ (UPF0313 family)